MAHLAKHGYHEDPNTPCLIKHETRPDQSSAVQLSCTLVVDDFGVKYKGCEHAEHSLNVLKLEYDLKEDWSGSKYVGLDIMFDKQRHSP
jgi:hypothetical protein